MSVRTLAKSVGIGNFATGTYTGDGGATQAVTGVGFEPIFVIIYAQEGGLAVDAPGFKTDQDGLFSLCYDVGIGWRWQTDNIISLDVDGFTVGDGTPLVLNMVNVADRVYSYTCWG